LSDFCEKEFSLRLDLTKKNQRNHHNSSFTGEIYEPS
jgi:hypothetical protein